MNIELRDNIEIEIEVTDLIAVFCVKNAMKICSMKIQPTT